MNTLVFKLVATPLLIQAASLAVYQALIDWRAVP
jgi:hypothetical protein